MKLTDVIKRDRKIRKLARMRGFAIIASEQGSLKESIRIFAAGKGLTSEEVQAAYARASTDEDKKAVVSANAMPICKQMFVVNGKINDNPIRSTFLKIFESKIPAIVQTIHVNESRIAKAIKDNKVEELGKEIFNRGSVSFFLIETIKKFFEAYPDRIMKEAFGAGVEPSKPPAPPAEKKKKAPAKKKAPKKGS